MDMAEGQAPAPILRTEHLKSFYILEVQGTQKVVQAVNDVNIQIYENEIYGIAGESGCGKTTLLKTIFNEIVPPLRLIDGKIYYRINGDYVDVSGMGAEEKRKLHGVHLLHSAGFNERVQSGDQDKRDF
jgi:peptide/nickel transport system ATP-binding protein